MKLIWLDALIMDNEAFPENELYWKYASDTVLTKITFPQFFQSKICVKKVFIYLILCIFVCSFKQKKNYLIIIPK